MHWLPLPQWPPLLSVVHHRALPSVVEARVQARQVFSLCGLLPEISRAWATVDNTLFLWRYDLEYVHTCHMTPARGAPTPRRGCTQPSQPPHGGPRRKHCALLRPAHPPVCLSQLTHAQPPPPQRSDRAPTEFVVPDVAIVNVTLCQPRAGASSPLPPPPLTAWRASGSGLHGDLSPRVWLYPCLCARRRVLQRHHARLGSRHRHRGASLSLCRARARTHTTVVTRVGCDPEPSPWR